MATFFGEVVTLPSRAVDEDDDEEEDEPHSRFPEPELQWKPDFRTEINQSAEKNFSCETLVIAIGPAATGFLEAHILWNDADIIGTVDCDPIKSEVRPESAAGHRTCSVYQLKQHSNVLICHCKHEMIPEIAHAWTQKIFHDLNNANLEVIVMDTAPTAEYRTHLPPSDISAPFIRLLQSHNHRPKTQSPALEPPNIIKGLSAAVLSHCQVYGLSCVVYIGYLDSLFLHIDDFKVFLPLFSNSPLKNIFKENPNADAVLRKLVERRSLQGSLYT